MFRGFLIATALCLTLGAAMPAPAPLPSVTMEAAHYWNRDQDRIGEALDVFDAQIVKQKLDLTRGKYKVELRLIRSN